MKYNNEPVYSFSMWDHTRNVSRNNRTSPIQRWYWGSGDILYLGKIDRNQFKFQESAPDGSTFLFDKYSEFPRTKLQYTTFKRCIKQDKADFIIVNSNSDHIGNTQGALFKIDDKYVLVDDIHRSYRTINDFIRSLNLYGYKSIECIYDGIYSTLTARNSWTIKVLDGEYTKPIMTDAALTKIVNKQGDGLSEDTINQVVDMLKSPDREVNKLALVTLCGFNTDQYRQSLKFLLEFYPNWKSISSTGVLIDNLMDSLGVSTKYVSNPNSLLNSVFNKPTESDEDEKLLKKLAYPLLLQQIEKVIALNFWGKAIPKINITLGDDSSS